MEERYQIELDAGCVVLAVCEPSQTVEMDNMCAYGYVNEVLC